MLQSASQGDRRNVVYGSLHMFAEINQRTFKWVYSKALQEKQRPSEEE